MAPLFMQTHSLVQDLLSLASASPQRRSSTSGTGERQRGDPPYGFREPEGRTQGLASNMSQDTFVAGWWCGANPGACSRGHAWHPGPELCFSLVAYAHTDPLQGPQAGALLWIQGS